MQRRFPRIVAHSSRHRNVAAFALVIIAALVLTAVSVAGLIMSDLLGWPEIALSLVAIGLLLLIIRRWLPLWLLAGIFVLGHGAYLISEPSNWLRTSLWVGGVFVMLLLIKLLPQIPQHAPHMMLGLALATPFPPGFFWGASTASHQVEGNTNNNWTAWEQQHASEQAAKAEQRYSSMPAWADEQQAMQDPNNYLSGSGDDQYNRYPEDLQIAHDLGLTAYRFSIEWSRVEPAPGVFDEKEIVHYQEEVKTVRAQGMEPFVTLWHWSVPNWFVEKGEWRDRANVAYFQEYAAKMAAALPEVKYWLTLNEPNVYSGQAYLAGVWPPGMHNPFTYLKAIRNLVLAHRAAYAALHQQPGVQVGIAQHFISYTADQGFFYDKAYAHFLDWWFNRSIPNSIADTQDFVGVNYYAQHSIRNFRFIATDAPRSDMGWELHPEGLYTVLKEAQQYGKPIYITESGLADAKDRYRSQYIVDSVKQIQRALADGVDVRGYFHWSLIDNFEWSEGFWPRFGLVAVDYATKQRTVRPSALEYAKIIKEAEGK